MAAILIAPVRRRSQRKKDQEMLAALAASLINRYCLTAAAAVATCGTFAQCQDLSSRQLLSRNQRTLVCFTLQN